MRLFELREGIALAIDAVRQNKLRSFLTILGVLIGVASVIAMVSIIQGLNDSMASQIEALGSNVIYVSKYEPGIQMGRRPESERNRPDITFEHDVQLVQVLSPTSAVATVRGSSSDQEWLLFTQVYVRNDADRWVIAHEHVSWPGAEAPRRHPGTEETEEQP